LRVDPRRRPQHTIQQDMLPEECQKCTKKKKIHLTQIVEGETKNIDLCTDCPFAKKAIKPISFHLLDETENKDDEEVLEKGPCAHCGYTLRQVKKTGRLGCPLCYKVFALTVKRAIAEIHRGTRHVGKVPVGLRKRMELESTVVDLERDLEQAIAAENYENAARFRDALKDAREKLSTIT